MLSMYIYNICASTLLTRVLAHIDDLSVEQQVYAMLAPDARARAHRPPLC
jgi:hypothetical protein